MRDPNDWLDDEAVHLLERVTPDPRVYAIWNRIQRWFRETPEQPALIFIGIVWTWFSVENCPHLTSIWPF